MKNNFSNNTKKVLMVFLVCFIGLISYITYFEFVVGPKIVNDDHNRRLWVKRNEVLRGTIYDKNMKPLTKSERVNSEFQKREYTGGDMFAHALGYVNIKYGITGLEKKYDEQLMYTDVKDTLLNFLKTKGKVENKVGHNLKTTLSYNVQKKAYDLLGNRKGAVVALNPKTGDIIAMVSKPSFDPNRLDEIWADINKDKSIPLLNRATAGLYPPGSTFKAVTAVSALENIPNVRNKGFEDNGSLELGGGYTLHNFAGEALGSTNFQQAFVHSSNVIFGGLGVELGNSKLKETAEKFYFNKNIPMDGVIGEKSRFPTLKSYEKGNMAQTAIGQGSVLASPMQMAVVTATIANNGTMMKPRIVNEILDSKGKTINKIEPVSNGDVISSNSAQTVKEYMREVVKTGTGRNASVEGIEVCGKTGTADHAGTEKGEAPHSWFIGFAPYNDPKVAVAVIVEKGGQGGVQSANIAGQVIQESLRN